MRYRCLRILLASLFVCSPAVTLGQTPPPFEEVEDPPVITLDPPPVPAKPAPFQRLFQPEAALPEAPFEESPQITLEPGAGSGIVCGMTIIPVDPAIDPGMVKPLPDDALFTMRTVEPTVCR